MSVCVLASGGRHALPTVNVDYEGNKWKWILNWVIVLSGWHACYDKKKGLCSHQDHWQFNSFAKYILKRRVAAGLSFLLSPLSSKTQGNSKINGGRTREWIERRKGCIIIMIAISFDSPYYQPTTHTYFQVKSALKEGGVDWIGLRKG